MCVIIDTNCLANVFSPSSAKHTQFEPVLNWIVKGHGKVVYGGRKYIDELKETRYLKIIALLNKQNKVIKLDDSKVDNQQEVIKNKITDPDFDDPHLLAIVIVSSCMIICSEDMRSVKFITNKAYYPKGIKVPKYYSSKKNQSLLSDNNIPAKYKPCSKCNKLTIDIIEKGLNSTI